MNTTPLAALPELIDHRAATTPDAPCLADSTVTLTNAEMRDRVVSTAELFVDLGVGPGDVVAVMLPNRVELLVTLFAAWRLGAAATTINPALTPGEAKHQLIDSGAKVLVTADGVGTVEGAVPVPTPDDLALLIYTSGTTGSPKGVMLDHANVAAMCGMAIDALRVTAADHSLLIL